MNAAPSPIADLFLGRSSLDDADALAELSRASSEVSEWEIRSWEASDALVLRLREAVPTGRYKLEPELADAIRDAQQLSSELGARSREKGYTTVNGKHTAPVLPPDVVWPAGTMIREYQIVKLLGRGGMGAVYEAVHTKLDRHVALKFVSSLTVQSTDGIARFEREMKAVGKLIHPNIVHATDAGQSDLGPYLAMELIEGDDLGAILKQQGRFSAADASEIVRQAAAGLQHVHEAGFVHRDIKPSNLMLDKTGNIKILDLGLARLHTDAPSELTGQGSWMGTADYMSPEQGQDSANADIRADLYSLGCTAYALLTGRPPFGTEAYRTPTQKLLAHSNIQPTSFAQLRPDLPAQLVEIFDRLLQKQPEKRFQTPAELIAAITPFCQGSDLLGVSRGAPLTVIPSETTQNQSVNRRDRNRLLLVAIGIMAAAIALLGVTLILSTPTGELVIHSDQADLQLQIEKSGSVSKTMQLEKGENKIYLTTGGYKITITGADGFTLDREVVSIRKGAVEVVKVTSLDKSRPGTPGRVLNSDGGRDVEPALGVAPFPAINAIELQKAWASYLGVPVEISAGGGMVFRLVPPGEFTTGSAPEVIAVILKDVQTDNESCLKFFSSESPPRRVRVVEPYYMSAYEITQQQYFLVTGQNPSWFSSGGKHKDMVEGMDTLNYPVEGITWHDAKEFCRKLGTLKHLLLDGSKGRINFAGQEEIRFRLPTELEWEFACRAGSGDEFSAGAGEVALNKVGWWRSNSGDLSGAKTHPVGSLAANAFGLFDCHGNVAEWMEDKWIDKSSAGDDGTGGLRVVRGGFAAGGRHYCRSAARYAIDQDFAHRNNGLRPAISVKDAQLLLKHQNGTQK